MADNKAFLYQTFLDFYIEGYKLAADEGARKYGIFASTPNKLWNWEPGSVMLCLAEAQAKATVDLIALMMEQRADG